MKPKSKPGGKRVGKNPMTGETIELAPKKAATKQPAKKRAEAKPASPSGVLRGVALVDAVMASRREKGETLTGMSSTKVAAMKLGDKPLSPALARWLEADKDMFTLGEPESIGNLLEGEVGEWAELFSDLAKYLKAPCVLFEEWGSDSRRFLYLGETDEHGEYPVFTIDTDDTPFACINGPVDVWLAQQAGFLEDERYYGFVPEAYEPARRALAKLCFGGNIAFVDGRFSKKLDH